MPNIVPKIDLKIFTKIEPKNDPECAQNLDLNWIKKFDCFQFLTEYSNAGTGGALAGPPPNIWQIS